MTALKSKLMATNESTTARLKQNAAVVDDLRAAEALVAKSEENIRKITGRISDLDREHGDLAADEIAGKVDSAAVAAKEKELADAGKDLERASKGHTALTARLKVVRDEQQRVATAEAKKVMQRKFAKFADLARDYEAVEKQRGQLWVAFHEVAAEITAAWPKGQIPAGCLLDRQSFLVAWERETYRQNSNPSLLGGQGNVYPERPPTIPGARCHDLSLMLQPEKMQSFVQAVAQAHAHLLDVLDGRSTAPRASEQPPAPSPINPAQPVERTPAQEQLGNLLKAQAELAEKFTPEPDPALEAEYAEVGKQIAALQ
jgi:hypothetical protein